MDVGSFIIQKEVLLRMFSFTFMNKSTKDFLDVPLALCSFEEPDEITGSDREVLRGENGIYRTYANNYGARYSDTLFFDYALTKCNEAAFTEEEQIGIETWLTSPKQDQYLYLYEDDVLKAIYCGTFTSTKWKLTGAGYVGFIFTFQCNSPYAIQQHAEDINVNESLTTFVVDVKSDELEEYVFPMLTFIASKDSAEKISISIKNKSDENRIMTLDLRNNLPIYIDCKNGIVTDGTTSGIIGFDDLGWSDVGQIYLLRFVPGNNELEITIEDSASASIHIDYISPRKLVGGWLT